MTTATGRTLYLTAVCVVVLWVAYLARAVVTPLLVALTLAYMLDPVVRILERRGLSRAVASGAVVVIALAALVSAVAVAATQFAQEARNFYGDIVGEPMELAAKRREFLAQETQGQTPEERAATNAMVRETDWNRQRIVYLDRDGDGAYRPGHAADAEAKLREMIKDSHFEAPIQHALESVASFGPKVAEAANSLLSTLVEGGKAAFTGFLGLLTMVILFPIYLYYSLVNLARVYDVSVRHLPQGQRDRIVEILRKIHLTMSAFFRGRLITMFVKGLLLLGLFAAFGVPFSFVCAGFAALASLVPVVGGVAAGVPPLALALPNSTGTELVGLLAGIVVVEIIEGYVLVPALVGKSVGLHPLTVLVCTLVAGDLLGFFGMIVAVPLTAVLKILAAEYVLPEVRRRAGLEPPAAPPSGPPPDPPPPPPPAEPPTGGAAA